MSKHIPSLRRDAKDTNKRVAGKVSFESDVRCPEPVFCVFRTYYVTKAHSILGEFIAPLREHKNRREKQDSGLRTCLPKR